MLRGEITVNKILLVEDEQIVRLALKSLVEWEEYNIDINYEAANGKEAIEILEKHPDIDIILTDINMPIMDGLELIEYVHSLNINPEIVVLSAYDDYSLVRKAFKIGINDYIIKAEMEPDKILELFLKIIEKKNKNHSDNSSNLLEKENKNKLLKMLIEGKEQIPNEYLSKVDLNVNSKNIMVCFLWIDDYSEIKKRYADNTLQHFMNSICNIIYQTISNNGIGEVICISPEEYTIIISNDTSSNKKVRETIMELLDKVRYALLNYLNIKTTIGISSINNGFINIHTLFEEAKQNAGYRYILGKGRHIYPEDVENIKFSKQATIIGKENKLLDALKELNKEKVRVELSILLQEIGNLYAERIEDTFQYYFELIFLIMQFLSHINQGVTNIFNHNTDFYKIISTFETQKEINEWIDNLVMNIVEYLIENNTENTCKIVRMSQNYIIKNYMKKITLFEVSEYVGLSEGYFSKLFTKEMNITFTQYLTNVRIEKAKELLSNPNKKIYEVCEEVGYESVEHFSRIFKKYTDLSPKKYQKIAE